MEDQVGVFESAEGMLTILEKIFYFVLLFFAFAGVVVLVRESYLLWERWSSEIGYTPWIIVLLIVLALYNIALGGFAGFFLIWADEGFEDYNASCFWMLMVGIFAFGLAIGLKTGSVIMVSVFGILPAIGALNITLTGIYMFFSFKKF